MKTVLTPEQRRNKRRAQYRELAAQRAKSRPTWSTADVLARIPVTVSTLANWRRNGTLKIFRYVEGPSGRKTYFYCPEEIEAFIARKP